MFQHGPAQTVFIVSTVTWAVFEAVMRVRQRLRATGPVTFDPSALVLLPCLGGALVLAELFGRRGGLPWPGGLLWPVVAGVTLIAVGIVLRAWAIFTLGRFFQYMIKVQPGHRVVTGGPYRFVRHPSYTGIALILIGIGLACDDVWSLVAVVVLGGIGLGARIYAEERQLTRALGAEYQDFAASRKRLVPGVW